MNKKLPNKLILYAIPAVIALAIPAMVNQDPYILHLLIITGITMMLVTSLRLVFSAGIWHVGQVGFYAIGAYIAHFLVVRAGVSFWAALPIAGLGAALIAWSFGYVTLRVRGVYFAILSIAFVEVVRLTITNVIGAQSSIVSTPPPNPIITPLFTIDFATRTDLYYLMLGLLAITLLFLYSLEKSRIGRTLKIIAQSGPLAESIGINVMRYEVLAFTIASFFGGFAGAFFASYNVIISPEVFTVWYSIILVVIMIVGGVYSFWGPVIGAVILVIIPTFLPSGAPEKIFYALLIIVILFLLPKGLVSLPETIRARRSRQRSTQPAGVASTTPMNIKKSRNKSDFIKDKPDNLKKGF